MSGDAAGRVRDLVDLARSETGLADFGGDEWREGLDVLVGSAMRESTFNEYGEQMFYGAITRALKTRLEVEDWYRRYPEIDEQDRTSGVQ